VTGFLEAEHNRRKAEDEKDFDWKLWMMYINSITEKSYGDWKDDVLKSTSERTRKTKDEDLTNEGIEAIMTELFPS
jgi:hypothetical protein